MAKPKGVAQLKKLADKYFSQYIRLRDSDKFGNAQCITCGTQKPWKELQAGHFVKRSVSLLRYDDENVNAQCMQCNVYKYGEQYKYAKELDLKYGTGTAEALHEQRFTSHKFTTGELQSIIDEAKENIKAYG
jgi:5-methylcytosine-specific restriction endonuclease McrA